MGDMDVTRSMRTARMATLGVGTAAGLVLALPVKTGSVACPPAHEGRAYCLLQHAWAPALVQIAACMLAAWVLGELLLFRLPAMRIRWKSGERLVRQETSHGREAVIADPVLLGANRGILPEPGREMTWVAKRFTAPPSPPVQPAPVVVSEPEPLAMPPAPEPVSAMADPGGVRALGEGERMARPGATLAGRLRILGAEDTRTRDLRREGDPALVVSCWSDLTAAKALPDGVGAVA